MRTNVLGCGLLGVIGTTHLVNAVVRELQVEDDEVVGDRTALFKDSPLNFVLESARLDPPVTSIATALSHETTIEVQGKPRKLPAGTPYVLPCCTHPWRHTAYAHM